jgi:hypothetical protein
VRNEDRRRQATDRICATALLHVNLRCEIPDFIRYHESIGAELNAVKDRVRNLVQHWLTDGEWKEAVLRTVLRRHLPQGIFVGSGFIVGRGRNSTQIDLLVLKQFKPMLFREGDVAVVAPEVPAVIVEVKSELAGPVAWYEALLKLAKNGEICRTVANNEPWLGLFAYEGDDGQARNILEAMCRVYRETQTAINCVCVGNALFVRYWPTGQHEAGDDPETDSNRRYWRAYNLERLAPSYFISNLIDGVCDLDPRRDGLCLVCSRARKAARPVGGKTDRRL